MQRDTASKRRHLARIVQCAQRAGSRGAGPGEHLHPSPESSQGPRGAGAAASKATDIRREAFSEEKDTR
ncbi:hypothetical protein MFU01_85660 [Myxococcus fulvus]|uniref:Uncharacterized protein n=1 Tax=Myxococcus fulvus TaxID=33 RepID=A0A511TH87_MYXFU|nr:hypothetical protein MFU01_85660 [Myxococcus fulvus]